MSDNDYKSILNRLLARIDDTLDKFEVKEKKYFTLDDLEKALAFTLISEGLLKNE